MYKFTFKQHDLNMMHDIQYISLQLRILFDKHNVCPSHGIDHALKVLYHVQQACLDKDQYLSQDCYKAICFAALLHDADDHKFFGDNDYENAKTILNNVNFEYPDFKDLTIKMIKWVSFSKNGDTIPPEISGASDWRLFPRYADRIESLGSVGIKRVLQYSKSLDRPIILSTTPIAETREELLQIASIERYNRYIESGGRGTENSAMSQFYDKIVNLGLFYTGVDYFDKLYKEGRETVIMYILGFWTGYLNSVITPYVIDNSESDEKAVTTDETKVDYMKYQTIIELNYAK